MRISEITTSTIDAYISQIKSPKYLEGQNSTRLDYRHELSVLKGILNYYISRFNNCYRLPFISEHAEMAKIREGKEKVKDLSVVELQKFLNYLKQDVAGSAYEQVYYLACLQYGLCARVQEAAAIHFEDFNLETNQVTVDKKIVWPRGKGLQGFLAQGSKANDGKRIPITEFAKTHLLEWVCKSGIRKGMLFKTSEGKPLPYRHIEYRYSRALKKAGLPFRGTHLLRHASLTELYDSIPDLKMVAKFAGHSSTKATEIYAKARGSKMQEAALLMDEKMKGLSAIGSKAVNQSFEASGKLLEFQGLENGR